MAHIFDEFLAELESIDSIVINNEGQLVMDEEEKQEKITTDSVDNSIPPSDIHHHVTDNNNESKFSPISCSACRKAHLACDRIKPSCSECSMRGRSCIYEPPKKRGRVKGTSSKKKNESPSSSSSSSSTSPILGKSTTSTHKKKLVTIAPSTSSTATQSSSNKFHPYLPSQNRQQQETTQMTKERLLVRGSIHHAIISYFYDFVDVNFDLVSREQMEEIASNIDLFENEYSVRTMLLAIQSLCEQAMSQPERSNNTFKESVRYSSLAHPVDFFTKISKILNTLYTIGEGQVETAVRYLEHIKEFQNDPLLDDFYKRKFKMIEAKTEAHITTGDDDAESLRMVWKSFAKFYDVYVNDNKYDLQSISNGVTLENVSSTLSLIYSVRDVLYKMIATRKLSNIQKQVKQVSIELMHIFGIFSTLKHLNFQGHALSDLVEKAELLLGNNSVMLPLFTFHNLTVFVYYRINQFDSIRNQVIEKLGQGRNIRDIFEDEEERVYFQKVLLHIKLVNSYSSRFRMVHTLFPRLVRNLNAIVKWKFDLQMTCLSTCITDEMSVNALTKETTTKEDSKYQSCFEKCKATNHLYSI